MKYLCISFAAVAGCSLAPFFASAEPVDASADITVARLDTVTVYGSRPTSLPAWIPATIEGVDGEQIVRTINASDSEDALKYLPSLLVRKRYIGDYNHAVLSTRASGTGNSARTMVYADGILLSNYLGNGAAFAPRWGMVAPDEIERVDVLYGPFSAAYPGNSAGAVVDYLTRMPTRFEAHAAASASVQQFDLYATHEREIGRQAGFAVGDRNGAWSWRIDATTLDSNAQPLSFATRMLADGTAPTNGIVVSGALRGKNPKGQDWWILGTTTNYHTLQDQARIKLAYDVTPTLHASYLFGAWRNDADSGVNSYLRDAAGQPVYAGNVVIGGRQYNLGTSSPAFAPTANHAEHAMHGFSLKRHAKETFDWEIAASRYDYVDDIARTSTASLPSESAAGAGRITDMHGTGWHTLSLRGIWRPRTDAPGGGEHVVEIGMQDDGYRLRTLVNNTDDWRHGAAVARYALFNGNTGLRSFYLQDAWHAAKDWQITLGLREEQWQAWGGELGNAAKVVAFDSARDEYHLSPKAAVAWQANDTWAMKAAIGRAVRMPTVSELYQGSINGDTIVNTDPDLRAEKSWTAETSLERTVEHGLLRATLFVERTRDALYSQPLTATVSTVQNIDAILTHGAEFSWQASDFVMRGVDIAANLTWADSTVMANARNPASVGKRQPRIPQWRASTVATWHIGERASATLAARYSSKQYGQLDNSDGNADAYTGFSRFFVVDTRLYYRFDRQWSGAIGADNLNNCRYWAFHPYPQRTVTAELKFDL